MSKGKRKANASSDAGEEHAAAERIEELQEERDRLAEAVERLEAILTGLEVTKLGPTEEVEWVWARRAFGYDGLYLDRGQIIKLRGVRNDAKLLDHHFFEPLRGKFGRFQCSECGAEFVAIEYRTAHGDLRHQHKCVCGEVFSSPEALRQHQRACATWQSSHRHLTPTAGMEQAPAGVGRPG